MALGDIAADDPEVRAILESSISHVEASERINSLGYSTSETSVRRYRSDNVSASTPSGWEREYELGPDGGTICSGPVIAPITDPNQLLEIWNLDPEHIEVVGEMTVKAWDFGIKNPAGEVETRRLFSYKARIRKRQISALRPEVLSSWREAMQSGQHYSTKRAPKDADQVSYVVLVADPQLGKEGTGEAVANWTRGVEGHAERIQLLRDEGVDVQVVLAFMGDETEGVANNYCVGAGEPVLTADLNWVPAGSLKAGDRLYALEEHRQDPSGRRYAPAVVTDCVVHSLPSVRVHFSDGTSLLCTPEHPLLVRPLRTHGGSAPWRWIQAKDLAPHKSRNRRDFVVHYEVCKIADPWQREDSFEAGWMSGILDGEGCLSGNGDREAPYSLLVSQKEGPILDRIRNILTERGFCYNESKPGAPGVVSLRISGGYQEVLRALGTFAPPRLLGKVGYPFLRSHHNVTVLSVEDAGLQEIAVMGTTAHTYFANGVASHNTNQAHTIELNLTEQLELDYDMSMWTLKMLLPLAEPGRRIVTSVRSNHGEWTRNGSKDVVTTKADNASTFIRSIMQKNLQDAPGFEDVQWHIGNQGPHVLVELDGVSTYLSHFYEQKGRGTGQEVRTRSAIERQIIGRTEELGDVKVFLTAHYHHFYMQEWEGRTQIGCPALEAEKSSGYMLNQYGVWSPPGMLGVLIGEATGKRGWAEPVIF